MDNINNHDEHLGTQKGFPFEWKGNWQISSKYKAPNQATLTIK